MRVCPPSVFWPHPLTTTTSMPPRPPGDNVNTARFIARECGILTLLPPAPPKALASASGTDPAAAPAASGCLGSLKQRLLRTSRRGGNAPPALPSSADSSPPSASSAVTGPLSSSSGSVATSSHAPAVAAGSTSTSSGARAAAAADGPAATGGLSAASAGAGGSGSGDGDGKAGAGAGGGAGVGSDAQGWQEGLALEGRAFRAMSDEELREVLPRLQVRC